MTVLRMCLIEVSLSANVLLSVYPIDTATRGGK
jgi:hypothetical protein